MKTRFLIWPKLKPDAMALFPFIVLRNKQQQQDKKLINHEQIHLRQQLELLVLPFYFLYLLNYLINLIRFKKHYPAYFNIRFEREAYANEHDFGYLSRRKAFSWFYYGSKTSI